MIGSGVSGSNVPVKVPVCSSILDGIPVTGVKVPKVYLSALPPAKGYKNRPLDGIKTALRVEARTGVEPVHKGFADLSLLQLSVIVCNNSGSYVPANVPVTFGSQPESRGFRTPPVALEMSVF